MANVPKAKNRLGKCCASWQNSRSSRGGRERNLIDGVLYKIADCREEREDAFRLIHDAYTKKGLMDANSFGMRVTPYHLLPTSDVFVAYHGSELIYTMTLISDDEMGMPLEDVYESEVAARREKTGAYFAEVSCLASRRGHFSQGRMFQVFIQLSALIIQSGARTVLSDCSLPVIRDTRASTEAFSVSSRWVSSVAMHWCKTIRRSPVNMTLPIWIPSGTRSTTASMLPSSNAGNFITNPC